MVGFPFPHSPSPPQRQIIRTHRGASWTRFAGRRVHPRVIPIQLTRGAVKARARKPRLPAFVVVRWWGITAAAAATAQEHQSAAERGASLNEMKKKEKNTRRTESRLVHELLAVTPRFYPHTSRAVRYAVAFLSRDDRESMMSPAYKVGNIPLTRISRDWS